MTVTSGLLRNVAEFRVLTPDASLFLCDHTGVLGVCQEVSNYSLEWEFTETKAWSYSVNTNQTQQKMEWTVGINSSLTKLPSDLTLKHYNLKNKFTS